MEEDFLNDSLVEFAELYGVDDLEGLFKTVLYRLQTRFEDGGSSAFPHDAESVDDLILRIERPYQ